MVLRISLNQSVFARLQELKHLSIGFFGVTVGLVAPVDKALPDQVCHLRDAVEIKWGGTD